MAVPNIDWSRYPAMSQYIDLRASFSEQNERDCVQRWKQKGIQGVPYLSDRPDECDWALPYFINKPYLCCKQNHVYGGGCHEPDKCVRKNHQCAACGGTDHGLFQRDGRGYVYCPIHRAIDAEWSGLDDLHGEDAVRRAVDQEVEARRRAPPPTRTLSIGREPPPPATTPSIVCEPPPPATTPSILFFGKASSSWARLSTSPATTPASQVQSAAKANSTSIQSAEGPPVRVNSRTSPVQSAAKANSTSVESAEWPPVTVNSTTFPANVGRSPIATSTVPSSTVPSATSASPVQSAAKANSTSIQSAEGPPVTVNSTTSSANVGRSPIVTSTDELRKTITQVQRILNKLTAEKFEKRLGQLLLVPITSTEILSEVISLVFNKALGEPHLASMYAELCSRLSKSATRLETDNDQALVTFKRLLLNKCQEEFERVCPGPKDGESADDRNKAFRERYVGNAKFIGELFKRQMMSEKIMHNCLRKLLDNLETPKEEEIEAVCKLLKTVGKLLDHVRAKSYIDMYFTRLRELSCNPNISPRHQRLLQDTIKLRDGGWVPLCEESANKLHIEDRECQAETARSGVSSFVRPSPRPGAPSDPPPPAAEAPCGQDRVGATEAPRETVGRRTVQSAKANSTSVESAEGPPVTVNSRTSPENVGWSPIATSTVESATPASPAQSAANAIAAPSAERTPATVNSTVSLDAPSPVFDVASLILDEGQELTIYFDAPPIGEGHSGTVYKGLFSDWIKKDIEVAVKIFRVPLKDPPQNDKKTVDEQMRSELRAFRECDGVVRMYAFTKSPCVLPLLGYSRVLVMERCSKDLGKWISDLDFGSFSSSIQCRRFFQRLFRQLLSAYAKLHDRSTPICHRDVKPSNVLVKDAGLLDVNLVLCDFSYSRLLSVPGSMMHTRVGTVNNTHNPDSPDAGCWVAPEVQFFDLSPSPSYSYTCDIWSLGVLLCWLAGGRNPFRAPNNENDHFPLITQALPDRLRSQLVAPLVRNLVYRMTVFDPKKRLCAHQGALTHPVLWSGRTVCDVVRNLHEESGYTDVFVHLSGIRLPAEDGLDLLEERIRSRYRQYHLDNFNVQPKAPNVRELFHHLRNIITHDCSSAKEDFGNQLLECFPSIWVEIWLCLKDRPRDFANLGVKPPGQDL